MSSYFLGQIQPFGFDFAPVGWAFCDGQIIPINQNPALFALIGTTYGGDGQTTMGLPGLQGRVPLHQGKGPGLSLRVMGESGGQENVTLNSSQIPSHNHQVMANNSPGTSAFPSDNFLAADSSGSDRIYSSGNSSVTTMDPSMITSAGGSQSHNNMPPFLAINWCIAMQGIFPSQG